MIHGCRVENEGIPWYSPQKTQLIKTPTQNSGLNGALKFDPWRPASTLTLRSSGACSVLNPDPIPTFTTFIGSSSVQTHSIPFNPHVCCLDFQFNFGSISTPCPVWSPKTTMGLTSGLCPALVPLAALRAGGSGAAGRPWLWLAGGAAGWRWGWNKTSAIE